jgi:hypothetical protein
MCFQLFPDHALPPARRAPGVKQLDAYQDHAHVSLQRLRTTKGRPSQILTRFHLMRGLVLLAPHANPLQAPLTPKYKFLALPFLACMVTVVHEPDTLSLYCQVALPPPNEGFTFDARMDLKHCRSARMFVYVFGAALIFQ